MPVIDKPFVSNGEKSRRTVPKPFTEEMLKLGIQKMLAIKMLEEKTLTVSQAAKIAGLCLIDMLSLASNQGVEVVDYDPKEIDDELAAYYG
jgi:predicted HTH domain antitoxin